MNADEAHYLTNDYLVERWLYQERDALLSSLQECVQCTPKHTQTKQHRKELRNIWNWLPQKDLEKIPRKHKTTMLENCWDPLHWLGLTLTPQSGLWVVPLALVMLVVESLTEDRLTLSGCQLNPSMFQTLQSPRLAPCLRDQALEEVGWIGWISPWIWVW